MTMRGGNLKWFILIFFCIQTEREMFCSFALKTSPCFPVGGEGDNFILYLI